MELSEEQTRGESPFVIALNGIERLGEKLKGAQQCVY